MASLNILHITPSIYSSVKGGGERYPFELAKALNKIENLKVKLITFGSSSEKTIIDGLEIFKFSSLIVFRPFASPTNPMPKTLKFLNLIDECDILHVHQPDTIVGMLSIIYCIMKGKKVVVTCHAGGYFKIDKFLPIRKHIDRFLSVSNLYHSYKYPKQTNYDIIYGGVDNKKFHPTIEKKPNTITFVGKISPNKGIDALVKAVQDLDVNLNVVAILQNSDYLKYLISLDSNNKVQYMFNLNDEKLVDIYSESIVTILPSVFYGYKKQHYSPEILGLVLMESLSCGTPVICSDAVGFSELVVNNNIGFVVKNGDVNELRKKIKLFLDNKSLISDFGRNGINYIEQHLTWAKIASKCYVIYYELKNQ